MAVFFPADDRLWQAVNLALESGHAGLLSVHRLGLDVEICHGCEIERGAVEILGHSFTKQLQSNKLSCLQKK